MFGNALNPQGITTGSLNNQQSLTYGGFQSSHADKQASITRLEFFVWFYHNAKTSSIMSPDL